MSAPLGFFYLTLSLYGVEQYVFSLQAYFGPSTSEMALLLETKKTAGTSDSEETFFLIDKEVLTADLSGTSLQFFFLPKFNLNLEAVCVHV